MSYDPDRQYRCTIIRGKARRELDSLLPAYAEILTNVCPCEIKVFAQNFNDGLRKYFPNSTKKTLDNHRTEIVGKLFGMYYEVDGQIFISDSTSKLVADNDNPAFFKNIVYKLQFPNGMDKLQTVMDRMEHHIRIRPLCFTIGLILEANNRDLILSKDEIGYYVLNSLDALMGKATYDEILMHIQIDRTNKIKKVVSYPGKEESYSNQHIREQLNLLELANLIRQDSGNIYPNMHEESALKAFSKAAFNLGFDTYSYDFHDGKQKKQFYYDWGIYYGSIAEEIEEYLETRTEALNFNFHPDNELRSEKIIKPPKERTDAQIIGDHGELLVYEHEKNRVKKYNPRLLGKVHLLSSARGLGYDIQTVTADGDNPEFVRYIEVKSSKRVTIPADPDENWNDSITLTRNEWIAAQQHHDHYWIYRVYITSGGIFFHVIRNPFEKHKSNKATIVPSAYRFDFGHDCIDEIINYQGITNA